MLPSASGPACARSFPAGPPGSVSRARREAAAGGAAPHRARSLRGRLAVHLRDSPSGDTDAARVCLAAPHRAPHTRSPGAKHELARPAFRVEGAARSRVRTHGAFTRHRVVHTRARPAGATAPRQHHANGLELTLQSLMGIDKSASASTREEPS